MQRQRILSPLKSASPSLTKRYEPVFTGLAVVKVSLRLVTYVITYATFVNCAVVPHEIEIFDCSDGGQKYPSSFSVNFTLKL